MTNRRSFFKSLTGCIAAAAVTTLGFVAERPKMFKVVYAAAWAPKPYDGAMKWVTPAPSPLPEGMGYLIGGVGETVKDGKWVAIKAPFFNEKALS